MTIRLSQIAQHLQGQTTGDNDLLIRGFSAVDSAREGDLTFAENEAFFRRAEASPAAAILAPPGLNSVRKAVIHVAHPRVAFARVLPLFFPEPVLAPGIHPTAVVDAEARIHETAHIGPLSVIGAACEIGPDVVIEAHCQLGARCVLADSVHLFARTTVYAGCRIGKRVRIHSGSVIGADGYGYVLHQGRHLKIPQVGDVIIHDDVEIGANVTIDRGALGSTVIGPGTKIDNLVQIAHNVVIGQGCIIVAQTGIAGSTRIGDYVTIAGQVGIAGHLNIGDRVTIAAQSGIMHDIPAGEKWLGSPALPDRQMKRVILALHKLPEWMRQVAPFMKRIASPSAGSSAGDSVLK